MTQEITNLLYTWHEDIVNGDFSAAWDLLSSRKQRQDEQQYGYSTWQTNQATLSPYLDPTNIHVDVLSANWPRRDVTVDVTGMAWNKPGAPCTEWSGITWVYWQNGGWRYDPGYSTTPQRRAQWEPRASELLGDQCG